MIREISNDWSRRVCGVALLEATRDAIGTKVENIEIKANYDTFMNWLRRAALDEVYIDVPMDSGESFIPYLEEMESMGLTVHFHMPLLDRIEESCCNETSSARLCRDLGRCAGGNLVTMATIEPKLRDQILKRLMDILGSLVGCIISIPIIAITAIPLKLESPGPLFFKQKRVGRNGRVFYIHKLRSMYMDAEERKKELMTQNEMNGLMFKMQDDPRITKVGKFIRKTSIDELPQFFDVLRGDMSLVGTRPPTLDEYKQYESHHKRRLSMKPGITGLIAAAHGNGRAGRAAGAAQHGKRGNQHQNGGKQANARQRGCADLRHMADIDAVHNVIQQVYHLRHHRGQCQLGQQLGNAAAPHIPVLRCSHNQSTSCVFVVKKVEQFPAPLIVLKEWVPD